MSKLNRYSIPVLCIYFPNVIVQVHIGAARDCLIIMTNEDSRDYVKNRSIEKRHPWTAKIKKLHPQFSCSKIEPSFPKIKALTPIRRAVAYVYTFWKDTPITIQKQTSKWSKDR